MNRGRYEVRGVTVRLQNGQVIDLVFPLGIAHYIVGGSSQKIPGGRTQTWRTHEVRWQSDFNEAVG